LSFRGCFASFFFSYGSTPSSGNHLWNKSSNTMAKWHTFFFGSLLDLPSIEFF
jgi:hypothetical protein